MAKIEFSYIKRDLQFRFEAGTSRGVLTSKEVFWIRATSQDNPEVLGWGEAAPLVKLSPDDRPDFEIFLAQKLQEISQINWEITESAILNQVEEIIPFEWPSIRFGVETALLDLLNGGRKVIFETPFSSQEIPMPINGLIWMGTPEFMSAQIDQKLQEGFDCIKMKIGAIDFDQELRLLDYIRQRFSPEQIVLRVDANGAFSHEEALSKLKKLAQFSLHSIEQPIHAGNREAMKTLCKASPLPIALDEELIGVKDKEQLLDSICPQYIILKPTLLGGIKQCQTWISIAEQRGIGWWMTSALESNIGLNAISQFTATFQPSIPQGLGTGKLFHNNLESPLEVSAGKIYYRRNVTWEEPA